MKTDSSAEVLESELEKTSAYEIMDVDEEFVLWVDDVETKYKCLCFRFQYLDFIAHLWNKWRFMR